MTLLTKTQSEFNALVEMARRAVEVGDGAYAAACAQAAASFAWSNFPGFFVSESLEEVVRQISRAPELSHCAADRGRRPVKVGDKRRVLHVLTQAYETGGHTRLVWRWIAIDVASQHSVVLTQQQHVPVPGKLVEAVALSEGRLLVLDTPGRNLTAIASRLGRIVEGYDYVVLHVHPFDVIPIIAFGDSVDIPTIFLNHADHVFWIGARGCDLYANLRDSGKEVAVRYRGIPVEKAIILPIPLPTDICTQETPSLPQPGKRGIVAITVASPYKFKSFDSYDYCEIHSKLLARCPDLSIVVVGPVAEDEYWARWCGGTNGRIRAIGHQVELGKLFGSADVYLDSVPLGSLTSLFEAALNGLACFSFRAFAREPSTAVFSCDDPALNFENVFFDDVEEYLTALECCLANKSELKKRGKTCREAIVKWHTGDAWRSRLEDVYSAARNTHNRRCEARQSTEVEASVNRCYEFLTRSRPDNLALPFLGGLVPTGIKIRMLMVCRARIKESIRILCPHWARSIYFGIKSLSRCSNSMAIFRRCLRTMGAEK